jgi:hypothetical protein
MRYNAQLDLIQYTSTPDEMGGQTLVPNVIKTVRGVSKPVHGEHKLIAYTTVHRETRILFQFKDKSLALVAIDAIRVADGTEYQVLKQNAFKDTISIIAETRKPRKGRA